MKIKILMITCNRPHYTRLSLERLCLTAPKEAGITVWDNSSDKETTGLLKTFEGRHPIERIIYSTRNEKLWKPTDWLFRNSATADLISKVDDDCLVPPGWCDVLAKAHKDIPEAGVLGCWRFQPEDLNAQKASEKIYVYGRHMIMRNCWVEGSGFLMKRAVIDSIGNLRSGETFTDYCIRAAAGGFINGWYYPFLYQEHMDDPRAEHSGIKTDDDFRRLMPLSASNFGIRSKEAWTERLRDSAQRLQQYSIDPRDFIGIRAKLKNRVHSVIGKEYFPKMKK